MNKYFFFNDSGAIKQNKQCTNYNRNQSSKLEI